MVPMMLIMCLCIFLLLSIIFVLPTYNSYCKYYEKNKKMDKVAKIITIIVLVICVSLVVVNGFTVTSGAHRVDDIKVGKTDMQMYCDDSSGEYFIILCDTWNPIKVQYRAYIKTDVAERYIETYRELQEIDVLGNLKPKN